LQDMPDLIDIVNEIKMQAIEHTPERTIVCCMLLKCIVDGCQNFQENSKQYLEKYRSQYDYCKAKNVELILDNREVLSCVAQGINDEA